MDDNLRQVKKKEEFDRDDRASFLRVLAETANVSRASRAVDICRQSLYQWREQDAEFRKEWDEAAERGTDALEDEAMRRAMKGTRKPVFYKGSQCGYIREYSDTLTIFLLKARRPGKYKDRSAVELTGSNGQPFAADIRMSIDEFNKLPVNEQVKRMQQALRASQGD